MCLDVTAVDHLANAAPRDLPEGIEAERFEVVVLLINHAEPQRLRLKVQVPEDDPVVPSLFEVHPGTEASSARCSTCSASPSTATPT